VRTNASVVTLIAAVALAAGCGKESPTSPSPVVAPTSLSISGRVTAADSGGALRGAIVKINGRLWPGTGPGEPSFSSDQSGRYAAVVKPVPAYPIDLDVTLEGFQSQHRQLLKPSDSTDFALVSAGTPVMVTGQWTATLDVSPRCASPFPLAAQRRVYDVTITQEASQASVTFRSPTLETGQVKTVGTAVDGRLSFVIAADSLDRDFYYADFVDHVSTTEELAIGIGGSALVSSTGFTMPMSGLIQYRKGSVFLNCQAPDHSLRFQPR
jgi:hypothetical protein